MAEFLSAAVLWDDGTGDTVTSGGATSRVIGDGDVSYLERVTAPWRNFNKMIPPTIPRLMLSRVPIRKYSAKRTDFISG
jgi:hypothetical protein